MALKRGILIAGLCGIAFCVLMVIRSRRQAEQHSVAVPKKPVDSRLSPSDAATVQDAPSQLEGRETKLQPAGGVKLHPSVCRLLGIDQTALDLLSIENARKLVAEKALGMLPRLRRGDLSLTLKSLWELEIRDSMLVDVLLPLYDLEERFGLMPTLLKLIALQDEPKGRSFLCSLGEDTSGNSIDRSFLSEALSVLAKRGLLTTKDPVGSMALQRIRDPREKSIDAFAKPLLIAGNPEVAQEVRDAFLDPSSKLRTHQNAHLGASLIAYDDSYLAMCAGSFSSFSPQGQVRVLRSLHLATGPLADELDKRLNDSTNQVSSILQLALKKADRDVRLEACRVVTSKPDQLTDTLRSSLHELAAGDPDESVRRAATHALNPK